MKNKWFMIGTEIDAVSLQQAQKNVQKNKLEELVESESVIKIIFYVDQHALGIVVYDEVSMFVWASGRAGH